MHSIDGQDARDRKMVEEMNIQNFDSQRKNGDQKKCLFIYNNILEKLKPGLSKPKDVSTHLVSNPFCNPQPHWLGGAEMPLIPSPDGGEHLPSSAESKGLNVPELILRCSESSLT